jgi:hypothetical protein
MNFRELSDKLTSRFFLDPPTFGFFLLDATKFPGKLLFLYYLQAEMNNLTEFIHIVKLLEL